MTDYSKITALYSRLSVGDEDRDGGESNSMATFTRKPPTITPYSSAEMKAAYRDTPISAAQPGVFGLM